MYIYIDVNVFILNRVYAVYIHGVNTHIFAFHASTLQAT